MKKLFAVMFVALFAFGLVTAAPSCYIGDQLNASYAFNGNFIDDSSLNATGFLFNENPSGIGAAKPAPSTFVTGLVSQAHDFNGTEFMNASAGFNLTGQIFTFSIWFKSDTNWSAFSGFGQHIELLLDKYSTVTLDPLTIFLISTNSTFHQISYEPCMTGRCDGTQLGGNIPNDNNWHNFIGITNGTIGTSYIDGVQHAVVPYSGTVVDSDALPLTIGGMDNAGGELGSGINIFNFNGSIDEFHLWTTALNNSEVAALYSTELAGNDFSNICNITPPPASRYQNINTSEGIGLTTGAILKGGVQIISGTVDAALSPANDLVVLIVVGVVLVGVGWVLMSGHNAVKILDEMM